MPKPTKRIYLNVEFHRNGKQPLVSFVEGKRNQGIPMTAHNEESTAFDEFSKAAYKFCQHLMDAGELG